MTWEPPRIYTGACIGGRLDGQMKTQTKPYFETVATPPISPLSFLDECPKEMSYQIERYKFHENALVRPGGWTVANFWIHESMRTVEEALQHIADNSDAKPDADLEEFYMRYMYLNKRRSACLTL